MESSGQFQNFNEDITLNTNKITQKKEGSFLTKHDTCSSYF